MHQYHISIPSSRRSGLLLRTTVGVAALMAITPAYAASADAQAQPDQAATSSTAADNTATADGVQDIVVTAQRRSESLQRSSVAISVLSADTLNKAGLTGAAALSALTPGVQIGGNGAFTQVFIRGIGDRSNTYLSNASVSSNLDGVPLLRSTEVNGNFFDVQRLEVLKGPQGTLYGRNATGGALNILTNRPTDELGGYINFEAGSYKLLKVDGAVNIPASDTLAFRGAFQVVTRDGYLSDGTSDDRQQNVRLSALWKPTADVRLFLSGGYSHQGGKGAGLAITYPRCSSSGCLNPWTGITDPVANTIRLNQNPPTSSTLLTYPAPGYPPQLNNETAYISAELNWDLGPAELTVLPSYVWNHYRANTYPGLVFSNDIVAKQTTVEARLSHDSSVLKWVAGVFYAHENQTGTNPVLQNAAGTGSSLYNSLVGDGASIDSKAAFAQATFSLTPRLRVIGGIRYTSETSGLNQQVYFCSLATCPGALQYAIDNKEVKTEKVTWKAGVEYDLTPSNFLYATYSTGFKAAGLFGAPVADPSYKPETIEAFQIGSRNRFFDNRLQINLEAYRWNYSNQVYNFVGPVPGTNFVTLVFINIGKGYVQGLSGDILAKPWHGGTLRFAAEYADSKYQNFQYDALVGQRGPANTRCSVGATHPNTNGVPVQTVDCTGRPFILAPKWSINASFDQDFSLASGATINAAASVNFLTTRYSQFDFLPSELLPKTALVNLDLSYRAPAGNYTVRAYVHNLTNVATYSQSQSLTGTGGATSPADGPVIAGTIGAPRTFGVALGVKF